MIQVCITIRHYTYSCRPSYSNCYPTDAMPRPILFVVVILLLLAAQQGIKLVNGTDHEIASLPVRLACPFDKPCNNTARKRGPDVGECKSSVHVKGIVEVYYNKSWQLISADGWGDADVNVVCGQLGYPVGRGPIKSALSRILYNGISLNRQDKKAFKQKLTTVLMKHVGCTGKERELRLCEHSGWGPFKNPSGKVATARCGFKSHSSCNNNLKQQVRIRI